MKFVQCVLLVLMCLTATACSTQNLVDRFAPKADVAFARAHLDDLRLGHLDAVKRDLADTLKTADIDSELRKVSAYFPAGEPRSIKTVGANSMRSGDESRIMLTFEYQFDSSWALGDLTLSRRGDKRLIEGLHVYRISQSLEQKNAFTLHGKGPLHYLVLLLACAIPLLCLYSLVLCIRTPMQGRKWPWILFILFGVASVGFNWATGAVSFQPVSILLFGASCFASPYGPWMISLAFPLGAVVFLLKRRSYTAVLPPPLK